MRYLQRKTRSGQTTAEYAIIVALVAVCSIAIIMIFGDQIRALIGAESQQIGGNTAAQNQQLDTSPGATPGQHNLGKF
ncbi:MAG: Flp family type IVb pilin [Candidatus Brocadiia bacterium]